MLSICFVVFFEYSFLKMRSLGFSKILLDDRHWKVGKSRLWSFKEWDILRPKNSKVQKFYRICSPDFSEILFVERHSKGTTSFMPKGNLLGFLWYTKLTRFFFAQNLFVVFMWIVPICYSRLRKSGCLEYFGQSDCMQIFWGNTLENASLSAFKFLWNIV